MKEIRIELSYRDLPLEAKVEVTIKVSPSSTEGELLDAVSRMACEAFRVARLDLEREQEKEKKP